MRFEALTPGEEDILSRVQLQVAKARVKAPPSHRKEAKFLMADSQPEDFRVGYQGQGNFIVCILERELTNRSHGYFIGMSKRNVMDTFVADHGRRIALRRAMEQVGRQAPWRFKP